MEQFLVNAAGVLFGGLWLWFFYLMVKRGSASGTQKGSSAKAERLERLLDQELHANDDLRREVSELRARLRDLDSSER